ncbi:PREDICTED: UBX domain-containing protein 6-like [Dinoponera quadriceps]|uniref:UBX domain-containing protein 6-like n=1 Tax=Dinoponera quadriceps TaxID=609295 RepID=A0A6P3WSM4_DINQU|nr:PREDICTED: UBX domain-containing protein 6-like [Dinoponera quadriceps]XP_014469118.1 PREDICTED: UBX domain-containing protein 6-like [Dinoponera quadriceps]
MADKIKSFFQQKKKDAKFMNAGKGYKLTESTSSRLAPPVPARPVLRAEPTEEAKIAGQAALARLEAKKVDKPRFNTSYAAIQARVKREMELERKAQQNSQQAESTALQEKKNRIEDPSMYAVVDVFFRCPYISDEILPRDQWKKKIRDFLYDERGGEEPGLIASLIIQNCNSGREKIENCVETLGKYLENIIKNPDMEKYWKIRMSNRIFQDKVLPIEGALDFLKAANFDQKMLLNNGNEEDFLVWDPDNGGIEELTVLYDALKSAEQIPIELDRNLQVLMPCQARVRNELPPSFFTISLEEIKKEQQLRTEAVERNQMLRTKAMREKDEQRALRRYKFAVLRIKFPDGLILQGTFMVHEKFQNVLEFVTENLAYYKVPFSLMTPDGIKLMEECLDKTLLELRLIPTAILEFSWNTSSGSSCSGTPTEYLKEEILSYIQSI